MFSQIQRGWQRAGFTNKPAWCPYPTAIMPMGWRGLGLNRRPAMQILYKPEVEEASFGDISGGTLITIGLIGLGIWIAYPFLKKLRGKVS